MQSLHQVSSFIGKIHREQDIMNPRLIVLFVFIGFCGLRNVESAMTMDQIETMVKGMRKSCLAKVPIDPELAANARNGQFPDDRDFKCYLRCLGKMSKGLSKNGKLDVNTMVASAGMLPANVDRVVAAIKNCGGITDDDECELAYRFLKCQYESDPEVFKYI